MYVIILLFRCSTITFGYFVFDVYEIQNWVSRQLLIGNINEERYRP